MKSLITVLASVLLLYCSAAEGWSQNYPVTAPRSEGLSAGISLGHYRYDPGIGIEFTTRSIFQNHLSLRLKASVQWLEAYKATHNHWVSYRTFAIGLVYYGELFERARFFAEVGILGISPNQKFSDHSLVEGFYQFNGLEVTLLDKNDFTLALFFGIGPMFTHAHAEKIEGNPGYGNGLHYVNGLRVYFKRSAQATR